MHSDSFLTTGMAFLLKMTTGWFLVVSLLQLYAFPKHLFHWCVKVCAREIIIDVSEMGYNSVWNRLTYPDPYGLTLTIISPILFTHN